VAVAIGVTALVGTKGRRGAEPKAAVVIDEKTPTPALVAALRESDARALAVVFQKLAARPDAPIKPLTEAETAEWVEVLGGIRSGFPRFGSYGRSSALAVVSRVLLRFAAEPAPANWAEALPPAHDLFAAGLNDTHLDVRVAALAEMGKLWSLVPAKPMLSAEEQALADWKDDLVTPVVRRLGDPEPRSRAAAVACLGRLPIDTEATPALACLEDRRDGPLSAEVRKQVIVSFAGRRALLTEDALLKHMYDQESGIPQVAEMVLKTRGLTQEQISLGSMIFHPKPEIRASVILLLKNRNDIDPEVWLLQLSRDSEASVRLGAVEALAGRLTPEVGKRLAEMAASDQSPDVRQAAKKSIEVEKTAALPPLPGAPSLNPKAN
jgi:hypothetical protein